MNKEVLVTGCARFLGSYVSRVVAHDTRAEHNGNESVIRKTYD
jgi:hypothetical protein